MSLVTSFSHHSSRKDAKAVSEMVVSQAAHGEPMHQHKIQDRDMSPLTSFSHHSPREDVKMVTEKVATQAVADMHAE